MRLAQRLRREAWTVTNEQCDNRSRRHGRTPTPACQPGRPEFGPCLLVEGIVAMVVRERLAAQRSGRKAAPATLCDVVHGPWRQLHPRSASCPA